MNAATLTDWASVTNLRSPSIVGFYYQADEKELDEDLLKNIVQSFPLLGKVSIDIELPEAEYWARFTPMADTYAPCVVASTLADLMDDKRIVGNVLLEMHAALSERPNAKSSIQLPAPDMNRAAWVFKKVTAENSLHPKWLVCDLRGTPIAGYSNIAGRTEWYSYIRLDKEDVAFIKRLKQITNCK